MIERGSYVAIMPRDTSPAADVLEIATVLFAGPIYIQLFDGRMYSTIGGKSLIAPKTTYIVPATDEHRAALRAQMGQVVSSA